jgi:predicted transcriptional regulator
MVDSGSHPSYPHVMEVHLSADVESKLSQLARRHSTDSEALVIEAVERLVNYDEWFRVQVEAGLAQIERGHTLSREEVGARLDSYL